MAEGRIGEAARKTLAEVEAVRLKALTRALVLSQVPRQDGQVQGGRRGEGEGQGRARGLGQLCGSGG